MGKNDRAIIGVGNPYRGDDGIGPYIIDCLKKDNDITQDIDLIDFGVDGLSLVNLLEKYKKVIIIDACRMNEPIGTIKVFKEHDMINNSFRDSLSTHGFGLKESLSLVNKMNINTEIIIIGIQINDISYNKGLSELMESKTNQIIDLVKENI